MKSVYFFPGQGSQRKGMGKGLFEKFPDLVSQADECLGYSIAELCLSDPGRVLNKTEYTQPALYVVNVLHYLDRVATLGEQPAVVAGHSLGEYCALFAAGGFDFATGVELVRKRGELMSSAPKGAMAAVVNLDQGQVGEILDGLPYRNIDIANINSRQQCILSGVYEELFAPEVRAAYEEAGAKFIPLNVGAAFHSRCMAGVQEEFAQYLATFEFEELRIPVVANYTARPYPKTGYADHLTFQISHPVRWYESVSWLMWQGYQDFHEIGPGNVLTKLTSKILEDPLPIGELPIGEERAPREVGAAPVVHEAKQQQRTKIIFMYGGQGTQYYQMGRALYDTHPAFRNAMDWCGAAYEAARGSSLVNAIYGNSRKGRDFDDILYSHAALYSIGYSLTQALREEGFHPDGVLGHSLGEYVAAAVAGVMSFEDGLNLVMEQARLLAGRCHGGMLSILAAPGLYQERRDLFGELSLAGVNFASNFVVSGASEKLAEVQAALDADGVVAVKLPVRHAFHSHLIDEIRWDCLALGKAVEVRSPRLPIYSSMCAGPLGADTLERWDGYLWDVIRKRVRFDELMASAFSAPEGYFFVDLSATGSFANFFKHGYGAAFRRAPAINQFGNNTASLKKLCDELAAG
jgi:malonyl CoA-acyl carrier protein transacylase